MRDRREVRPEMPEWVLAPKPDEYDRALAWARANGWNAVEWLRLVHDTRLRRLGVR